MVASSVVAISTPSTLTIRNIYPGPVRFRSATVSERKFMPEDLAPTTVPSCLGQRQPITSGDTVSTALTRVPDRDLHSPWYVVQTKAHQEDRAAANLRAWNVESYVPWLPARRRARRCEPMFPGYIFSRFTAAQLRSVSFTRGVAAIVRFGGIPATIEDDVIVDIRRRIEQYHLSPKMFNPGDPVAVKEGPFRNLVGIVETEMPSRERVRILLMTASRAVRLEISRTAIAKAQISSHFEKTDAA